MFIYILWSYLYLCQGKNKITYISQWMKYFVVISYYICGFSTHTKNIYSDLLSLIKITSHILIKTVFYWQLPILITILNSYARNVTGCMVLSTINIECKIFDWNWSKQIYLQLLPIYLYCDQKKKYLLSIIIFIYLYINLRKTLFLVT